MFERTAPRDLLCRLRLTAVPGKRVGDHVMPERCVFRLGRQVHAPSRQPGGFIEVLLEVEVQLRQEEMPLGKAWVDLDRPAVCRCLRRPIADPFVAPTEVEPRL
jgi:hypothetical protein